MPGHSKAKELPEQRMARQDGGAMTSRWKEPSPAAGGVGAGHGSNHRVSSQSCLQGLRLKPLIQDLAQEKRRAPGLGWGAATAPSQAGREEAGGSMLLLLALTLEMGAVSTS